MTNAKVIIRVSSFGLFEIRLNDKRRRPVVDEMYLHIRAETSGGNGYAERADGINQMIEQALALIGSGRAVKRRSAAFAGFGGDGEVADQQNRSADLRHVQVEMFIAITKDAQGNELLASHSASAGVSS